MYTLEISLRYSPFPISIQKKQHEDVLAIYNKIKNLMEETNRHPILSLDCEKMTEKSVTVLVSEIIAVQIYEKSSIAGGSKRPGFSLEN